MIFNKKFKSIKILLHVKAYGAISCNWKIIKWLRLFLKNLQALLMCFAPVLREALRNTHQVVHEANFRQSHHVLLVCDGDDAGVCVSSGLNQNWADEVRCRAPHSQNDDLQS
jgi:hypothetical protein